MSNKELVQGLLGNMPDDISLLEIARKIEFMAAVRQGLDEIERGDVIPLEEVEGELPQWVIR